MSNTNGAGEPNGKKLTREEEMIALIENGDWDTLDRLIGISPEETERILREEPRIDASEVNRMLGITDEEIAEGRRAEEMRRDAHFRQPRGGWWRQFQDWLKRRP